MILKGAYKFRSRTKDKSLEILKEEGGRNIAQMRISGEIMFAVEILAYPVLIQNS